MRYYFNIKDGIEVLDDKGLEFEELDSVRTEAVHSASDMLKGLEGEHFWSGEPWVLWVTDQPNGGGNTVMTLTLSCRLSG